MQYVHVLLPIATEGIYTYIINTPYQIGSRVLVPFGKGKRVGIIIGESDSTTIECKEVIHVLDETPIFTLHWLQLLKKMSEYYAVTMGQALYGVMSAKVLKSEYPTVKTYKDNIEQTPIVLSDEQCKIINDINLNKYEAHLIHGITGSGKTEVYLKLIEEIIAAGKQAYYLVPEISLTPQLIERIESRLGIKPALFHSKLTEKKREENFWRFARGELPLIVGARSALFVPSPNPGIIIVDEEHETTYKQEETPAYHLRDMAVLFANIVDIPVVLGSATPQVESIYNTTVGKYKLHHLKFRPGKSILPTVEIIDTKDYPLAGGVIAEPMYDNLCRTVEKGEQAIIFLNRKGYATSLFCHSCGTVQLCKNCSVPLTLYKTKGQFSCNYCGTMYKDIECEQCGGTEVNDWGAGTERVEEFFEQMFPNQVLRIDADVTSSPKQLEKALNIFNEKKAKILIGTQLIAKGLHFPDVTYVGVLGIDNIISMPDFRATEKAYQLIMQVSGRAGRGDVNGHVQIQTTMPHLPLFEFILNNHDDFYEYEIDIRKNASYPPYSKIARLVFSHTDADSILNVAERICREIKNNHKGIKLLGPAQGVIYKIKNRYRYSVILKSPNNNAVNRAILSAKALFEQIKKGSMNMKVDKDPYNFL